ncbi:protein-glutamate O-methyltransferase CheR [uncultured Sphingomonas sp.]|uniref:CheR family methyltransferase n=1 Tax=uncultured Sphingomonas sp. TaxID=158754 RepID=UPI0025FDB3AB|nr:protein-glutamate O-methyltransferase CheR [uncultured Sphingomonas sp.]
MSQPIGGGGPPPASLSADDFRRVTDLLYRWTGMTFRDNKHYYIERRVAERVRHSGAADMRQYLALLASDAAERQALINACTVNETYFYREDYQFAALARDLLPRIIERRRPGDLVRLWSLPCSTGEEPYSIAIWLLENWRLVDAYNVEIVGSDIDTHAVEQARAGCYGRRALSRMPPALVDLYFEAEHRHRRRIIADLRESVHFTAANIIDSASVAAQGRFDVVLCRNLLIYFDEASRAAAAANLFDALNPGGFLCLGHSESMARIDERFILLRLADAIVYRKP